MSDMRIGYGEDIHRLEEGGNGFPLGGVTIPSGYKVVAHSDGDVVYHAIADALLGSLGLGDIGELFPDTDEKTRGLDSALIVGKAHELVREKGYEIVNVDASIVLEKPKVAPFKDMIKKSVATALELDEEQVSIKAMTNEKLDAIGNGKAVKAMAILLVKGGKE